MFYCLCTQPKVEITIIKYIKIDFITTHNSQLFFIFSMKSLLLFFNFSLLCLLSWSICQNLLMKEKKSTINDQSVKQNKNSSATKISEKRFFFILILYFFFLEGPYSFYNFNFTSKFYFLNISVIREKREIV